MATIETLVLTGLTFGVIVPTGVLLLGLCSGLFSKPETSSNNSSPRSSSTISDNVPLSLGETKSSQDENKNTLDNLRLTTEKIVDLLIPADDRIEIMSLINDVFSSPQFIKTIEETKNGKRSDDATHIMMEAVKNTLNEEEKRYLEKSIHVFTKKNT